jgi:serine/threonine protein kinase
MRIAAPTPISLPVVRDHPDRVGRYAIGAALGEGGFARVFQATGPDGEEVAVKIVRADVAADRVHRRRFEREIRAAVGVEHVHVVPVLAAGEHEGVPYLVQPLLRGGTLKDRLAARGPLEPGALVRLCGHVARGLGGLHERGIVHRDVKPANILFDEHGKAYVADFGLVKERDASLLTRPGQAVGSLDYMAPEQIRGEAVTPAADVYALGCVAWECLRGAPPFGGRDAMEAMFAHLHDEPGDPCAGRPDVPPGVGRVVVHALAKAPADRPPTAMTFARLLQAAAAERA